MHIERTDDESVIIKIGRTLDFGTAGEFKRTCHAIVREGARNFILDFSETKVLDSTGLGAIFSLYRAVSPLGGVVVFSSLTTAVMVVVQMTRINNVFPHYASVQAACRAVC